MKKPVKFWVYWNLFGTMILCILFFYLHLYFSMIVLMILGASCIIFFLALTGKGEDKNGYKKNSNAKRKSKSRVEDI